MSLIYTLAVLTLAVPYVVVVGQSDGPLVSTDYGDVRGFQAMDRLNRTYDAFIGVPFAKPPVGALRWQPSVLPDPWDDVLNATEFSLHCIQPIASLYRFLDLTGNDTEDCLYLNIYVPISTEDALANPRPVMVFYYGGGYALGTANMYPGEELAGTGDVIVVTVNYRVSTMGFFSTGDSAAPGNYGLWDAKTSLEWIRANIGYFGGDASRVTTFGQSAGSSIVSHMMISPQTNQLFNRGIGLSGAAGYMQDPKPTAEYMAGLFDCSTSSSQAIVDCLRTVDAKELDNAYYRGLFRHNESVGLDTVIDGTLIIQDTRASWTEGIGGHIDYMAGYTHHDSAGFVINNVIALPVNRSDDGNKNAEELYESIYNSFSEYENQDEIVEALYDQYPGMNDSDPAVASEWVTRYETDYTFASKSFYQLEKHVESQGPGSSYFYEFRHRHEFLDGYPSWVNGSHLDDIYSVFGEPFFKPYREWLGYDQYNEEDSRLSETVMKYYANFAYSGNPNTGRHVMDIVWPEYDLTSREVLMETPYPVIRTHTQDIQDQYNWLLYNFTGMMNPGYGSPTGVNKEFLLDLLILGEDY